MALENQLVQDKTWDAEDYITHLRRRDTIGMVVVDPNGKVLGSVTYQLTKDSYIIRHIVAEPGNNEEDVLLYMLAKLVAKGRTRTLLRVCVDVSDQMMIQVLQKAEFSFPQEAPGDQLWCGRLISKGLGNT